MSANPPIAELSSKLSFSKKLQALTNRIHATQNLDEIMLDLSQDICDLFEAERMTLYVTDADNNTIVSKVKTGLHAFKDLRLPINHKSIAGYAAAERAVVNIRDVYNEAELHALTPDASFLADVDQRTGFHSKQMLVAPVLDAGTQAVLGVVQLINTLNGLPFSAGAEEGITELAKTLAVAFTHKKPASPLLRGKFDQLVVSGTIAAPELELAMRAARKKSKLLEDTLIDDFQIPLAAIGASLAAFYQTPYEPYKADRIKPIELLKNLKREYVESSLWLPLEDGKDGLIVLTPDPERIKGSRVVNSVFPTQRVQYRVCTAREFFNTVKLFYGEVGGGNIDDMLSQLEEEGTLEENESVDLAAAADNELVKLVNKIIIDAYNQGVSDIHIEPYPGKNKTEVRFRRDGSLFPYIEVPANYRNALVTRLKIMCDLDIAEKRKPQDGKIAFKKFGPLDIELRVATLPTAGGMEDVVMRILAAGEPLPLEKLALSPRNVDTLKSVVSKPYGLFLVCGPTGSGKTTTLHSVLKYLNRADTKIWTAEDPVEITQKGLRQTQVNPKAGFTFAMAMRAFLRADPDVIMVGEMRDGETADTGVEASLTGHLVLSTLHTNSAPESVVRLLDMGMDPFNFADALLGILAQRLAKRLCDKCRKPYQASADVMRALLTEYCEELAQLPNWQKDPKANYSEVFNGWQQRFADKDGQFTLYKSVGCEACNKTGYKGRVALHELLVASDEVKRLIQERARVAQILACALAEGMRTLKQDGIEKVLQGLTDMAQVRAVCIK